MLRATTPPDPTRDAGALLRRLGFVTLAIALPLAALFFRRGTVIVLPIGAALLVGAATLDGLHRPVRESVRRLAAGPASILVAFAFVWAGVSVAWSPVPGASAERLLGVLGTAGLALAGYLSLPDRSRSSNLYLVPIGVGLAAVAAIAAVLAFPSLAEPEEDGRSFERGMAIAVLFAWPAIGWLRSRDRDGPAMALVLAVTLAALLTPQPAAAFAFAAGALAFVVTAVAPRFGVAATAALATAALALVPVSVLLPVPNGGGSSAALPLLPMLANGVRPLFANDPLRLLTGHGFGAFVTDRLAGRLPAGSPGAPILQLWYDLGILGALSVAGAIWTGLRSAARGSAPLLPAIAGAVACIFTLACTAAGALQAWQPVAAGVLALLFVAIERGQFRTRRPKAGPAPPAR